MMLLRRSKKKILQSRAFASSSSSSSSSSSYSSPTGPPPLPSKEGNNRPAAAAAAAELTSIPAPTWSMAAHNVPLAVDVRSTPPLPLDQWHALCRRAGVWPGSAENDDEDNSHHLRQDLAHWMHLVEQVVHFREEEEEGSDVEAAADGPTTSALSRSSALDDSDAAVRWMYDLPRGLDAVHPMGGTDDEPNENENDEINNEALVSERVRESLLHHRAVQLGGHSYFAVPTTAADEDPTRRAETPLQPPQR